MVCSRLVMSWAEGAETARGFSRRAFRAGVRGRGKPATPKPSGSASRAQGRNADVRGPLGGVLGCRREGAGRARGAVNEGTATGTWAQQLHWAPRETMRNLRVKIAPRPGWAALGGFAPDFSPGSEGRARSQAPEGAPGVGAACHSDRGTGGWDRHPRTASGLMSTPECNMEKQTCP